MRSLLAVAIVAATASAASAGTYLGLGIGTAASPGGDIMPTTSSDGNRSGRLILGTSFGRFSVEGNGERFGMFRGNYPYQATSLAAAVKYSLPLGDQFEAFGRAGLERTWLNTDVNTADWAGNGWLLGAGFEYRVDLGGVAGSVFVDYRYTDTNMVDQGDQKVERGLSVGLWTLGVTVTI